MGNGMTCRTTSNQGVLQGGANHFQPGAAPPPPPTGAVGGGVALHPSALVVLQMQGPDLVPMPRFLSHGGGAGWGLHPTHTLLLWLGWLV